MVKLKSHIFPFIVLLDLQYMHCTNAQRSFEINYESNTFMKDGVPFRYISGDFHYFRTTDDKWADIFRKFRLAGLNAVQTYVEWRSHQPTPQQNFTFAKNLDLFKFLSLAQQNNLSVILRPGPYIDAERDMGGLPAWLLESPNMQVRTNQSDFIYYVSNWFGVLLTMLKPYLYKNGGPIIMIQVENEYGSFGCDMEYKTFLRDLIQFHLGSDVVLFTTDNAIESHLKCGSISGVYSTVDFGPEELTPLIDLHFATQRTVAAQGPLVNSEFYVGWMDHWKRRHNKKSTEIITASLDRILEMGANVNMYMFFGGTSFGLSAGSSAEESKSTGGFDVCTTSYDYDAPLDEAGDPTEKYFAIKSVIAEHFPVPHENPGIALKANYGQVSLRPLASIFEQVVLQMLDPEPITKLFPLRFESIGVGAGFVLYETTVKVHTTDPVLLTLKDLRDRAYVFANEVGVGILDRSEGISSLPITVQRGDKLRIIVENMGRMDFGPLISESKGIGAEVNLGKYVLDTWTMYRLRDFNGDSLLKLSNILNYGPVLLPTSNDINSVEVEQIYPTMDLNDVKTYRAGMIFTGTFFAGNETKSVEDTYIQLNGWRKGLVWINGFLLGRYWPAVGPQVTMYLPRSLLHPFPMENNMILLELQETPFNCTHFNLSNCSVSLVDRHILDGPTPC